MINIMIADDHPLVREGLKKTLLEESDVRVVCEAKNGREVLSLIEQHNLDMIVMDISMPVVNGLDVLKEFKKNHLKIPVLILSMHPEERFAIRAFRAGAAGYLTKECAPIELIKAIRKIALGKRYITPSLADQLAGAVQCDSDRPPHDILSDREMEVLRMIASGISAREISEKLFLSINTVNTYRCRIFEKLQCKTNIELAHYAVKYRLIESE